MNRRFIRRVAVVAAGLLVLTLNGTTHSVDAVGLAGSQGTDTSIPPTDSAKSLTVSSGRFQGVTFTVSQTANLANQAVSVSWSGAAPTTTSGNYMQVMQCWGDDDGTNSVNPGPPPEQCEQGASTGNYGSGALGFQTTRIITQTGWANYSATRPLGFQDSLGIVWLPFRAVDGVEVKAQINTTFAPGGTSSYWLNPYFNQTTTNELAATKTFPDGTGTEIFQVQTGLEAPGLGCGERVQATAGGNKVPKCWLVIVPRGEAVDENIGTPQDGLAVGSSPVMPNVWKNRVAFPLDFNPLDSPCDIGAQGRRIIGSSLAQSAVSRWQPTLCLQGGLPPYSFAPVSDTLARQQLVTPQAGAPGMFVVSEPVDPDVTDPEKPIVYTPITLSGLAIGFNIERVPRDNNLDEEPFKGVRVASIKLTPRLVAKLVTQSYRTAVSINSIPKYPWFDKNPFFLTNDKDFLQFNPEFALLSANYGREMSALTVPLGASDATKALWQWILADPEAKAWLDGNPDPWGMRVNPVYATTATANSTGFAFGDPTPNIVPRSDPYCYQAPSVDGAFGPVTPPPLCGTDWLPYQSSFDRTAYAARFGTDGAKIGLNPAPLGTSDVWGRLGPQSPGGRTMVVLTDTPSAAAYGLQVAELSRAGDDEASRTFVGATDSSLTTGVSAMRRDPSTAVLTPDPSNRLAGAYPLTLLSYAAISPLSLDAKARSDYAAFLDFATGAGQARGDELGQVPRGFVSLPSALKADADAAIAKVRTLTAPPTTTTTTTPDTTVAANPATPVFQDTTVPVSSAAPVVEDATVSPAVPSQVTGGGSAPSTAATSPDVPLTVVDPTGSVPVVASTVPPSSVPAPGPTTLYTNSTPARFAVPSLGALAVLSALGGIELTSRPRRRRRRLVSEVSS
jgi:hypothetical protein